MRKRLKEFRAWYFRASYIVISLVIASVLATMSGWSQFGFFAGVTALFLACAVAYEINQ